MVSIFVVNLGKRVKNLEERLNEAEKAAAWVGSVEKEKAELPPRAGLALGVIAAVFFGV